MELEIILLSEISQTEQKNFSCFLTYVETGLKKECHEYKM
jgi:hypothetical protein